MPGYAQHRTQPQAIVVLRKIVAELPPVAAKLEGGFSLSRGRSGTQGQRLLPARGVDVVGVLEAMNAGKSNRDVVTER